MNTMRGVCVLMAVAALASGCNKNKTGAADATSMASSATAAAATAGSLYSSLGGTQGVQALANSFGAKLAIKPSVTKYLDAAALDAAKGGLTNTIMALAGQTPPAGTTDLVNVLKPKGLDAAAMADVGTSLMEAGSELKLKPEQMAGLGSLMQSVTKSVMGN